MGVNDTTFAVGVKTLQADYELRLACYETETKIEREVSPLQTAVPVPA